MTWVPCGGCDDWYCTRHDAHTADCDCPEIQDWETDPYTMTDERSEAGRALASLRRRTTAICEVCGAEFETWERKTQQARTCSNRCRQALFRRAHSSERPGERPS